MVLIKPNMFVICSNIDKIKNEAAWNDENQRWRIPELITERTKLPPAGRRDYIGAVHDPFKISKPRAKTQYEMGFPPSWKRDRGRRGQFLEQMLMPAGLLAESSKARKIVSCALLNLQYTE